MTAERLRILNLVAEKKISADEAANLLDAIGEPRPDPSRPGAPPRAAPRYGVAAPAA